MKNLIVFLALAMLTPAIAVDMPAVPTAASPASKPVLHRYLIERTFPAGALQGLDSAAKKKVNANNAAAGVRWVQSYANANETKTYCVYEAPNEAAIRKAAELNKLPIDSITEVPVTLTPK